MSSTLIPKKLLQPTSFFFFLGWMACKLFLKTENWIREFFASVLKLTVGFR